MKQSSDILSYVPVATSDSKEVLDGETANEPKGIYPCPCCGYNTLPIPKEDAVAHICPVCFWENDIFTSSDDEPSDENHGLTLNEGRKNYETLGACCKEMVIHVREPRPEEFPN